MTDRPSDLDESLLRRTFELAADARRAGNHPFGALLADLDGAIVMEARNTVITNGDVTAHAELNLIAKASMELGTHALQELTLYASTEPCPMCAGSVYWGGVSQLVFGLSQQALYQLTAGGDPAESFLLGCRQVLAAGGRRVEVVGPCLEEEAARPHAGFWGRR